MIPFLSPEPLYRYIHKEIFNGNDYNITVYGTFVVSTVTFWVMSILFMYPDLTGKPKWLIQCKIQPKTNQPVDKARLWKAVKLVLFNDFVVGSLFLVVLYPLQKRAGCSARPQDIPSVFKVVLDYYGMMMFDEIWFYSTHRLFHWRPLYRHIHKIHHQWYSPVAIVTSYSHPVEHVISNLIPISLGSLFMSSHLFVFWAWIVQYKIITVIVHSGYKVPHLPSPEYHDYHHLKLNGNYSSGYLDKILGTDMGTAADPVKKKSI